VIVDFLAASRSHAEPVPVDKGIDADLSERPGPSPHAMLAADAEEITLQYTD
jgi:hypothetical protein